MINVKKLARKSGKFKKSKNEIRYIYIYIL